MGVETIKTAGHERALGLRPVGCTPALSVSHSVAAASVCSFWCYMRRCAFAFACCQTTGAPTERYSQRSRCLRGECRHTGIHCRTGCYLLGYLTVYSSLKYIHQCYIHMYPLIKVYCKQDHVTYTKKPVVKFSWNGRSAVLCTSLLWRSTT